MPDDVRDWLENLGLSEYAEAFVENRIGLAHLADLTEDDLRELGISAMGDRKTLLRAIANLGDHDAAPASVASTRQMETISAEAERRQLTVMFCDLAGSTALSIRLDPEDYREVIRAYQDACAGVVTRYDGYVAKFMGDGVLAYFGWPRGHEDDAVRAISAGLGVVEAVSAIAPADGETEPLAVRVGIATGPVVVGDIVGEGTAQEAAVAGETPNLAARLQEIAEANSVAIAGATHTLAGGLFDYEALGGQTLKGIAGKTDVWRVLGERRVESRFAAAHTATLTPLIGRDEELDLLSRRWERAKSGNGQVVLLSGEPGIGKSRLLRALQDWIGDEPHTRLLFQCSPHHTNSALYPTINHLEFAARFETGDDTDTRLAKLEALLQRSGQPTDTAIPLLAALLSIPADDRYPLPELTPQQQKDRTLAALIDQLAGLAAQQPVLFIFEDAHWIDPTSLELLGQVIERVTDLPVFVVVTYRPEFTAPWIGLPHVTLQALNRLTPQDCARMAERLIGDGHISAELLNQITERTDGVPLFIEELTRSVVESGGSDAGERTDIVIPVTLQDALEARFDRSPAVREVAQIGAAIGREFPHDLLSEVTSLSPSDVETALGELANSGLIFVRGTPPAANYTFKHALVQDTAYDSMVRSKRKATHIRIADALLSLRPSIADTEPETLAHHYTEARLLEPAIDYWLQAGRLAASRSANPEAVALLERGLATVAKLPAGEERDRRELDVQVALHGPLIPVKGQTSPYFVNAVDRALELCEQVEAPDAWFRASCAKIIFHVMSEQMSEGHKLAADLREKAKLAVEAGTLDDGVLVVSKDACGRTLFFLGRLAEALEELNEVAGIFDRKRHDHLRFGYLAMDPEVTCTVFRAMPLWLLGWPDQARQMADQALSKAFELGHVNTLAMTLAWTGTVFHMMLRDLPEHEWIGKQYEGLTSQHNLPVYRTNNAIYRTLLEALEHPSLTTATRFENDGVEGMLRATRGPTMLMPTWYCWLAETFLAAGEPDRALTAIAKSFEYCDVGDERWYEAELHRIRGVALAMRDSSDPEAEEAMIKALAVAKPQNAKSLELRAATSLARLWQSQGKQKEAHDLLAPVYEWFTEGFDTQDLKDAKALLEELS